jgi:hypothetical protein
MENLFIAFLPSVVYRFRRRGENFSAWAEI